MSSRESLPECEKAVARLVDNGRALAVAEALKRVVVHDTEHIVTCCVEHILIHIRWFQRRQIAELDLERIKEGRRQRHRIRRRLAEELVVNVLNFAQKFLTNFFR